MSWLWFWIVVFVLSSGILIRNLVRAMRRRAARKLAVATISEFTRTKLREGSFYRRIAPVMSSSDE